MPTNQEIARILSEIGEYLDMAGVAFKPRAYEKVAETISSLQEEVNDIYKRGGLKALTEIPGVGTSIADHIEELIKTGRLKYYEQLKKKTPVDLFTLTQVEGLGPKKIKRLYKELGIRNLGDLEKAAKAGKIGKLEGFGEKSAENILKGIEFVKKSGGRFILGYVMPDIRIIEERLRKLKGVDRLEICGSIRRRKETVADIDILAISDKPKPVMDFFVNIPEVVRVYAHGPTKSMVRLKIGGMPASAKASAGIDADLRVVPPESYGAALNYFTGSRDHNVALRKIAIQKGWKLSEYGLFSIAEKRGNSRGITRKETRIAGRTEEELYKKLGMDYIEPEMREMTGELEASKAHKLPKLIGYGDLKGDLQTQTNWTDGSATIEEMAVAAQKAGLEYIVITDHTKRLAMTHGLDARRLAQQIKEIDKLNERFRIHDTRFKILKGTECDILRDGSLDLPDEILRQLDVVGVSVHSLFNLSEEEQTKRIIKAMKNPHADILFHPTGRLIQKREPYDVDMEEIIRTAKETGTILEINAYPDRLDLKDEYIRKCVNAGVKMSIDSDAHSPAHFAVLEFGIAQARRGWATKTDIINTRPVEQMLKLLK